MAAFRARVAHSSSRSTPGTPMERPLARAWVSVRSGRRRRSNAGSSRWRPWVRPRVRRRRRRSRSRRRGRAGTPRRRSRGLRLDQAEHRLRRDQRVRGGTAVVEHLAGGLGGEGVRGGHRERGCRDRRSSRRDIRWRSRDEWRFAGAVACGGRGCRAASSAAGRAVGEHRRQGQRQDSRCRRETYRVACVHTDHPRRVARPPSDASRRTGPSVRLSGVVGGDD